MLLTVYRLLVRLLAPFLMLLVWLRAMRGHEETAHLQERRGLASLKRPEGRLLWVHAASVGEMRSILPLVQALLLKNEDLNCLITTVTVTAARMVRHINNSRVIHQYAPFDHPTWVSRFLTSWSPDAAIWVESELWPTMLARTKAQGIPLIMVNGRLSARSAARWGIIPRTIKRVLGLFDLCLAQSADDAKRLESLGAHDIKVAGNMKYAGAPLPYKEAALEALRAQIGDRPTILMASTHDGEEEIAARTYRTLLAKHPKLLMIVMPRHPKRGEAVCGIFEKDGLTFARRSKGQPITDATAVYVADTLGEPGMFYRLCPIVYLGNSLISSPGGGHNPIEPAQLGCAIVYGSNMWNFLEIDVDLRAVGGAVIVRDEKNLCAVLGKLLSDDAMRAEMGAKARQFVETQNGVLENALVLLRPYLERAKIGA